jgi:hypothetical protein
VLSTDFLAQLVRASRAGPPQAVARCLEDSLAQFLERQHDTGPSATTEPLEAVAVHLTATPREPNRDS